MAERPVTNREGSPVQAAGLARPRQFVALTRPALSFLSFCRAKPLGAFGAFILIVMVFVAVAADWVAPADPLKVSLRNGLAAPSWDHPFGTDNLGRDVLSRVIHGARPSLYTGLMVVSITGALGMVLGVTSAYLGGVFDLLFQRLIDGLMAFPGLILAMALLSVFSSGIELGPFSIPVVWKTVPVMVVIALSLVLMPTTSRVARAATLGISHSPYVDAARVIGCSHSRIIFRHLIPNVVAPLIVVVSSQLGAVILIEASLSFLGFGLPPPNPSWGNMLQSTGRQFMESAPWLAIFPGFAISLTVLAFNLLGDSLRDVLDPRLKDSSG